MHKDSPYSFWTFIVLFTFSWIILYTTEPEFVKGSSVQGASKVLCGWYAFVFSMSIVVIFWFVFYAIRWRDMRVSLSVFDMSKSASSGSGSGRSKAMRSQLEKLEEALM